MKIAVPSTGENITSPISETLGRAPFLIIYDSSNGEYNSYENPGFQTQDGSGLKASEVVLKNNADVLLTREIGRKSYSELQREHIKINLLNSSSTVKSVVSKFLKKS